MAARENTGLLRWFSLKRRSSDPDDAEPSGNTSRLELEQSAEDSSRPADSDEISSSLYPDSSSESTEDLSSSTSSFNPEKRVIPPEPNQPKLNFPKQKFGSQQRAFCTKWYKQFPWLHYL